MRVLHVFPDFVAAGPELRAVALAAAFGPALRHAIVSLGGRTDAARHLPRDVVTELLPPPPRAGSLATARRLRRVLARQRPDLVLTYNWAGIDMVLAAAVARYRHLVHHEDGFGADESRRFKLRRVWARRVALRVARQVVVPSASLAAVARRRWRVPERKLACIANGVHVEGRARADGNAELRRRLGIAADTPLVGTVGHLRAEKALARLIAAIAELPAAHLLIVGDGPERAALERRAAAVAAGRVHFAGHQDDPAPWYRCMDAYALASTTEQLPVALLEAMATALPVVATDVGDVAAALPAVQRELVVAGDGEVTLALRRALARLLADRALRHRLGAANRERVAERFSFARMAVSYAAVYRAALDPQVASRWLEGSGC